MKKDTIRDRTARQFVMKQTFSQKELHQREAVCTAQDAPPCQATCPVHVDCRSLCQAASMGDFKKAVSYLYQAMPFPNLCAATCSGFCQTTCAVAEKSGVGVSMLALEQACLELGGPRVKPRFILAGKKKVLGICGDDLMALACAYELGKKGYTIRLYTEGATMDGGLREYGLTEQAIASDMSAFHECKVTHIPKADFSIQGLETIQRECHGLCLHRTLPECPQAMVFQEGASPVETMALAKKFALMVDGAMQGVTDGVALGWRGSYVSTLFVDQRKIVPSQPVLTGNQPITKEHAMAEASRCAQCQCTTCMDGCVFLQHYQRGPRKTIREICNNLSIVMGTHSANEMINSCTLCGQCSTVCPNGFDVAEVCQLAREIMIETGKMPPSAHGFAIADLEFSNEEAFLSAPQPGFTHSKYLYFPGCQATAVSPQTVEKSYADLQKRLDGGVGLMLGCCGAIALWAGRKELFHNCLDFLEDAWQAHGEPQVICGCPTCLNIFKTHTEMDVVGIWDVLLDIGLPTKLNLSGAVAVQDACGARNDPHTQQAIRTLLTQMGLEICPTAYEQAESLCCGFGGLVSYANPPLAQEMTNFCAEQSDQPFVTYCMACRDRLTKAGAESNHLLELVYGVSPETADISKRRRNRLRLKKHLLKELWSRDMEEKEYPFTLQFTVQAKELMEERMILEEDVYGVMTGVHQGDSVMRDEKSNLLVARRLLGHVTFWVKFTRTDRENDYIIHSAYSHRMKIEVE